VGNILSLWEGWCVFPAESQEGFVRVFNNPPLSVEEEADIRRKEEEERTERGRSRWKAVEVAPKAEAEKETEGGEKQDVDEEPIEEDFDGEPMVDEDEDLDGVPMEEDDEGFDGEPMDEDVEPGPPEKDSPPEAASAPKEARPEESKGGLGVKVDTEPVGQPRRRPRAVDMFADSDDEDT